MNLFLMTESERLQLSNELNLSNMNVQTTHEAIYKLFPKVDNLIITKDYIHKISPSTSIDVVKVLDFLFGTKIIYLRGHEDSEHDIFLSFMHKNKMFNIYYYEIKELDNKCVQEMLSSVITKEIDFVGNKVSSNEIIKELNDVGPDQRHEILTKYRESVIDILDSYTTLRIQTNELLKSNELLTNNIRNLQRSLNVEMTKRYSLDAKFRIQNKELSKTRKVLLENKEILNRRNYELAKNMQIKTDNKDTLIIVFKQFEDIGFLNYFKSLSNVFEKTLKMNVKTLVVEDKSNHFYNPYGEEYLKVDEITTDILIDNNKFVKYGNPKAVIETLLDSKFRVEVLIVLDRTSTDINLIEPASDEVNIFPLYLGYKRDRYENIEIENNSFISPLEGDFKSISPLLVQDIQKGSEIKYEVYVTNYSLTQKLLNLILEDIYDATPY